MKKCRVILFLLVCMFQFTYSQAQESCITTYLRTYTSNGHIEPYAIRSLGNGETLIAGRASQGIESSFHLLAVKLSSKGEVIWSLNVPEFDNAVFTGITLLADGSYLFYGAISEAGGGGNRVIMANTTIAGQLISARTLSTGTTKNRLCSIQQFSDGDLIGVVNINDSTDQSVPLLFKLSTGGVLKWAKKLKQLSPASFSSLGISGENLVIGGFCSDKKRRALKLIVDAKNGAVIDSRRVTLGDDNYDEEITHLEVSNDSIFLKMLQSNNLRSQSAVIQSPMNPFEAVTDGIAINNDYVKDTWIIKRTPNGLLLLNSGKNTVEIPHILKLSRQNDPEWSSFVAENRFSPQQVNVGVDFTSDGGGITAGYFPNTNTYPSPNGMVVARFNARGESGNCLEYGNLITSKEVLLKTMSIPLDFEDDADLVIREVSLSFVEYKMTENIKCENTYCLDSTPLEDGCNKTSLIEYQSLDNTILRDFSLTGDGGKIAVGSSNESGLIMKVKENGNVEWAKLFSEPKHVTIFHKIIRLNNGNYIAFANKFYHYLFTSYEFIEMIEFDQNGSVLASKKLSFGNQPMITDIADTEDGGFVIIANGNYGFPPLHSYAIKFDDKLQVVWNKELEFGYDPVLRSVSYDAGSLYIAHDIYGNYNETIAGLQKLDAGTGKVIWSRSFDLNIPLRINKLFISKDTIYTFLHLVDAENLVLGPITRGLFTLTTSGEPIQALQFTQQTFKFISRAYYFLDEFTSGVSMTADGDFIISDQMDALSGPQLNITRISRKGQPVWSKNYAGINRHFVHNMHSDGSGFSIVGGARQVNNRNPHDTHGFIFKVDGNGDIGASADVKCVNEQVPIGFKSLSIAEVGSRIKNVSTITPFEVINYSPVVWDGLYYPKLICGEKTTCVPPILQKVTNDCEDDQTQIFFLSGNDCTTQSTWKYDTTFFKVISISEDTLKLYPLRSGDTKVRASIENDCSTNLQEFPVTIMAGRELLNLGSDTAICAGSEFVLYAQEGFQSYTWNDGSNQTSINVNQPGEYNVTVTDACGKSWADTIRIDFITDTFKIYGRAEKCNNDTLHLHASEGYSNYEWTSGTEVLAQNSSVIIDPLAQTQYVVTAISDRGCHVSDSLLISVKSSPPLNLGQDTTLCFNQELALSAPPDFEQYVWSTGDHTQSITVKSAGTYFLAATAFNGCVSNDTVRFGIYASEKPALGNDTAICVEPGLKLSPGNYVLYQWNTGESAPSIIAGSSGLYWVQVTDKYNCVFSDTIRIKEVYDNPVDFLPAEKEICFGEVITLKSEEPYRKYQWSTGSQRPEIMASEPGTYSLEVTDKNGCKGTATTVIKAKADCPASIDFFNAFTPNNDGLNETFKPVIKGQPDKYFLRIYNRFGEVVFSTEDPSRGWDGRLKGEPCNVGAYAYVCQYQFPGFPLATKRGSVMLIR